jgi:hypothetical protein
MSERAEGVQSNLEELAAQQFREFSDSERKLLVCAASGASAYCGPPNAGPNNPQNGPGQACTWGSERRIRGELIAWLCADRKARKLVHARGLTVAYAKIAGKLDLSAVTVPFPLIFFQCYFCDEIRALYSDLLVLSLEVGQVACHTIPRILGAN